MKYFRGKRVLVYGMGKSGQAMAKLLYENEACVGVFDDNPQFQELFCFEENPLDREYDMVAVSPGIKVIGNKIIETFLKNNVSVVSELDLGASFCKGTMIAITGTNGKTTVTSLVGEIFKNAGKEVFVCGNIGVPLCLISQKTTNKSFVICEVSNFQLELSSVFNPDLACILNLQEDHIDRHGNFAEYVRVKNKITQNFGKNNLLIYNMDDENSGLVNLSKRSLGFSKKDVKKGCFIREGVVYFNKTKIMKVSEIPLIGEKNIENVLAGIAICCSYKIKPNIIRETVMKFTPHKHRLELVSSQADISFYDDSKATNVACVEMAIESLNIKNIILLVGGQNKNCNFDHMFSKLYNLKFVLCFGSAGEEIYACAKKYGYKCLCFENMKNAVLEAKKLAEAGDVVLLSPGCASFDEFSSYAERGDVFKEIVCGKN